MKSINPKHTKVTILIIAIMIFITVLGNSAYILYSYNKVQEHRAEAEIVKEFNNAIIEAAAAREAKKKEPVYISLPNASKIRAIVEDYTNPASIWTIASKEYSLPIEYIPSPIKIPDVLTRTDKSIDERSVRSDIEQPLIDMFTAASSYGYQLLIGSGYRSANLQAIYFNSLARAVGEEAANQSIARPGQSEHQTGLAVDITTVSRICYLEKCFEDTSDGMWLAENAHKYGFIMRYPEGKEPITGYIYEPWHFRYVGVDLATALYESGLTMDEAWPYLEEALATLKDNGAI